MLARRDVLKSGAALAAVSALGTVPAHAGGAALNALFDRMIDQLLDFYPEYSTSMGIDTGSRARQRAQFSDQSLKGREIFRALNSRQLAALKAFDRKSLSGRDALNYDAVLYAAQNREDLARRFAFGFPGGASPYVIDQLDGAYHDTPDFLDSQHPIEDKNDAEAYLARLVAFARQLDNECEVTAHDAGLGVLAPDFALDGASAQMQTFREQPAERSVLVQSLVRRTKEKSIAGNWGERATALVNGDVYPALDRQIALLKNMRPEAVHDAGVWRLPDGEAYYAAALEKYTTTTMAPAEVHRLGLDIVNNCAARIDAIMRRQGLTKGTVGERLRIMFSDPKYRAENTDEAKEKLIAELNIRVQKVQRLLPAYFGILPKAGVEIVRVPKYIEANSPAGYYQNASLDGKRPGRYYINLRNTAETPSWTLPTVTYHESIPGHHLQISIALESPLPLIRKMGGYGAYMEGWALYAEQLAVEMGLYEDDPLGHVGQLHDDMLRAVRLVADSGMHAMRWSREKAVRYYADTLGDPETGAITEIERYCVWPGQACSYMVGKIDILRLRDKAKAALGPRFDIRAFHDAVLSPGALPLKLLENVVDDYIVEAKV